MEPLLWNHIESIAGRVDGFTFVSELIMSPTVVSSLPSVLSFSNKTCCKSGVKHFLVDATFPLQSGPYIWPLVQFLDFCIYTPQWIWHEAINNTFDLSIAELASVFLLKNVANCRFEFSIYFSKNRFQASWVPQCITSIHLKLGTELQVF